MDKLKFILLRLKEPSTMAGIAVLIQITTGVVIPPEVLAGTASVVLDAVSALAALAAIFMKEKSAA
jgi:hypothetical protein